MRIECLEGGRDNTWFQIYSKRKRIEKDIERVLYRLVGGDN